VLEDTDERIQYKGPMVVVTSRVSASASEILAGAVKDYSRAVVVGDDHTFGKGTVQNIVSLPPGFGALKVTTAHFFRPGGASTQSTGVAADVRVPTIFNNEDYGERHQDYALPARSLKAFRTTAVNSKDPMKRWQPITSADISALAAASAKRIANHKDFKKVRETLEKRKKNNGIIKISEILDDPENKKKDENEKEEEKLSAQVLEGVQVLGDLVVRKSGTDSASKISIPVK
jgi:carboxyl-terminal processing protease